ncbi:MAG: urease accessory protein UreF [Burkholderiaceae bacterium]
MNKAAQLALMRLASPALPIGGFSYSQGLESAIAAEWVHDEKSLVQWLSDCLALNFGQYEAPLMFALIDASVRGRDSLAHGLHLDYLASRETAELHAETLQMGFSLLRLLAGLSNDSAASGPSGSVPQLAQQWLADEAECSLPLAWGLAARHFRLDAEQALTAYAWAWLENQVAAAIKAVPLGQQSGQRVFDQVQQPLIRALERAAVCPPDDWSNFAPGLAMASAWHETQYSRLFRS